MARIGIAILSYNSLRNLPDCLGSLRDSIAGFPSGEVDVMVWDNASSDGSAAWVREHHPWVKVVESKENLGFAAGNNRALEALKPSEYFVLLNDDTVVDKDWLSQLIAVANSRPRAMVVQSRLMLWPDKEQLNSWGNEIHFLGFGFAAGYKIPAARAAGQLSGTRIINYASGAAMLVKMSLLQETYLFDNDFFMYHEDLDLGWRVRLLGYETLFAPKSVVYHKYSFKKSIKKYYFMERNRFIIILQNYHVLTLLMIMPALLAMELGSFGFSLFSGWWKEKFKVYAYILNPVRWPSFWRRTYRVQKSRKAKEKDVVSGFTGKIEFQDMASPLLVYVANPFFGFYWRVVKRLIVW